MREIKALISRIDFNGKLIVLWNCFSMEKHKNIISYLVPCMKSYKEKLEMEERGLMEEPWGQELGKKMGEKYCNVLSFRLFLLDINIFNGKWICKG